MDLTPRLKAIADSIIHCHLVADIGSDHAHLPIYLLQRGRTEKAIATDINIGPAKISKERIKHHGLLDFIDVRVGYGLQVLNKDEADVIVISGMGGLLIIDILSKGIQIGRTAEKLILQPMRDNFLLRKWLIENSFEISDVELVKEEDRFYEIIWALPSDLVDSSQDINYIDDKLLEKKSLVLFEYIESQLDKYRMIAEKLKVYDTPNAIRRQEECIELIGYYEEVKSWLQLNAEW